MPSKDSIRFLISDANKKGGLKSVERMVIELADTLRHTKFYEPLVEYRLWVRKLALLPRIRVMKGQGMSNSDIAEKLGISSAEVSIISKKQDFFDFGGIGN